MTTGELVGAAGVSLLLIAFLMNLIGRWEQKGFNYILLNSVGALMACASSMLIHFLPFIILEGVWALVSLISLINYFRKR